MSSVDDPAIPSDPAIRIDIVSIFTEYFAPLELSLIGRARKLGLISVATHDLRDWTSDVHRTVDDTPYGGGPGMVMRPEPWGRALDALVGPADTAPSVTAHLVVPTPAGTPFTQAKARQLAEERHLVFACGRYEGIDERVVEQARSRMRVSEVSLGDYVLFGGEVAVLAMVEAIARLVPGALGNADSLVDESHTAGLLEAPMYTKPACWRGLEVPEVLRSGDHGKIARWRRDQALLRTARLRPDLVAALPPSALDRADVGVLTGGGLQLPNPNMAE